MKYKLKELDFNEIIYNKVTFPNGHLFNIKYKDYLLEFQTPKVFIEKLIKENDHEFIILRIIGTEACKKFCSKIFEFEQYCNDNLLNKNKLKSIFDEDTFIVKIPFKYSKPLTKVYKDDNLFNYYHLSKGMEIICLVTLDKLWVNSLHEPSYNLTVKEIMVI